MTKEQVLKIIRSEIEKTNKFVDKPTKEWEMNQELGTYCEGYYDALIKLFKIINK